jgi:hypothetical protein
MPARLQAHAARLAPGTTVLAYQTIFIDYLPPAARAAYRAGMEDWVRRTPSGIWLTLEIEDHPGGPHPAAIRATLCGRSEEIRSFVLARCGFHPSVVVPDGDGVAALRALAAIEPVGP